MVTRASAWFLPSEKLLEQYLTKALVPFPSSGEYVSRLVPGQSVVEGGFQSGSAGRFRTATLASCVFVTTKVQPTLPPIAVPATPKSLFSNRKYLVSIAPRFLIRQTFGFSI